MGRLKGITIMRTTTITTMTMRRNMSTRRTMLVITAKSMIDTMSMSIMTMTMETTIITTKMMITTMAKTMTTPTTNTTIIMMITMTMIITMKRITTMKMITMMTMITTMITTIGQQPRVSRSAASSSELWQQGLSKEIARGGYHVTMITDHHDHARDGECAERPTYENSCCILGCTQFDNKT